MEVWNANDVEGPNYNIPMHPEMDCAAGSRASLGRGDLAYQLILHVCPRLEKCLELHVAHERRLQIGFREEYRVYMARPAGIALIWADIPFA